MKRLFVSAVVAALAFGLSAVDAPVLETSPEPFASPLVCNGEVGAGKAYPEITSALDAADDFTISMWVKIDRFPTLDDKKAKGALALFCRGWRVRWDFGSTLSAQFTYKDEKTGKDRYSRLQTAFRRDEIRTGDWNHYALVYSHSRSNVTLYVNGRVRDSYRGFVARTDAQKAPVQLGTLPGYFPMNGEIGRTRIWTRALGADELFAAEKDAARTLAKAFGGATDSIADMVALRNRCRLDATDRELSGGKSFYWATVDPMANETFLPDARLDKTAVGRPLEVVATPGEYEAASFIIRSFDDLPDFMPVVSALKTDGRFLGLGRNVIPPSAVDVRIVKTLVQSGGGAKNRHIRVMKPAVLLHDDALVKVDAETMDNYIRLDFPTGTVCQCISEWGDKLQFEYRISPEKWPIHDAETICPLDLKRKFGQQYWLTLKIPENAAPGLYRGNVALTSRGKKFGEIPLKLRVLPYELPVPRTNYDLSRKVYPGVYYRHYGHDFRPDAVGSITSRGRNERQFRAELRSLRSHGILYPTIVMQFVFPGWNWNDFHDSSKGGVERIVTDEQRAYFKRCMDIMKEEGFPTDQLLFHSGGNWGFRCSYDRTENREVLKRSIEASKKMVRDIVGTDEGLQFYGVDEAGGQWLLNELELWKDARELGGHIFTTCMRQDIKLIAGRIDTIVSSGVPEQRFSKIAHDAGSRIWSYANPQAGSKAQAYPYRCNFGFGVYFMNYDGFSTYAWNVSATHPWNDFDNPLEPDLAFVIGTADGVVETPAFEGYREAVDDLRYATKLREEIVKAKAGGDARKKEAAEAAEAWLAALNPLAPGFDPTWIRLQIIDWTLQLLK
ncbi:MAG: hypothetical protein PHV28_02235 [Kiritimatiellae bacterium]|nr:hypothetical protein [Kiritimatiellia bacterium]